MIGYFVSLATIPLTLALIWGLVRQVRKEQPVTRWTPVVALLMAPIMLLINILLLRKAVPNPCGPALLVLGLGFGLVWGQTTRLQVQQNRVVAKRSALHLIFWAVSYATTQLLAVFAPATWVSAGLAALFFSTGTTLGTNLNLLLRCLRPPGRPDAAGNEQESSGQRPTSKPG